MKIGTFVNFKTEEDIQIQTSIGRILFKLVTTDEGSDLSKIKVRARIFSSRGSSPVIETRTGLDVLFEVAAAKEGFYRTENISGNVVTRGMVEISSEGALALNSDQYISLDIDSEETIIKCELWAVGGPFATTSYLKYSPITVQETVKDVPLAGIDSLVFRPTDLDNLKLQYADTSPEYDREELEAIACCTNDLVSVNFTSGTCRAGFLSWVQMATNKGAQRATITPNTAGQKFTVYALSSQKL